MAPDLNVSDLVDRSKIGAFQISIFILCALCLIMDGFDVQAMGYVAPAVIDEWHISNSVLGPVFGAALLGIDGGTLAVGHPADVCVFDPSAHWTVERTTLKSQGKNTPFLGLEVPGRVKHTLIDGVTVGGVGEGATNA